MNLRYKTSVASEKGIREINEDFYLVIEHKKDTLIVLCDGVGSEEGSEIAALTTIKIFEKYFKRRIYWFFNFFKFYNFCIRKTIKTLKRISYKNKNIATTLCVAYIHGKKISCANLGDSRIFFFSNKQKEWKQISHDHNLLNQIMDKYEAQRIKKPEFENIINQKENDEIEYNKNHLSYLTKCIEPWKKILPNDSFYQTIDNVNDNDMILVATDGLYNFIENNLINSLIEKTKFSAISKELTDIALKNGSNDNITSILLKFGNGK